MISILQTVKVKDYLKNVIKDCENGTQELWIKIRKKLLQYILIEEN